jgi:hypothetical protein
LRRRDIGYITIDTLPNEVLLEIFKFYVCDDAGEEEWEELVHVCRRWRDIAFAAPRSLDMRLVCTGGTPAREMIDIWPALPILIRVDSLFDEDVDNVVAALERNDRVREISICDISYDALGTFISVMQKPFPELTRLFLGVPSFPFSDADTAPVLPESFLGGSAPRLQSFHLNTISFPAVPKLLSSARHLVHLTLRHIPPYAYFPPAEAMVDWLSTLTRLERLEINFQPPLPPSHPIRAGRLTPPLRTILPFFTSLYFRSGVEHIEEFYTRIQAPLLDDLHLTFLSPPTLDIRRIFLFTGSTEPFNELDQAHLLFDRDHVRVTLSPRNETTSVKSLKLSVRCRNSVWQLRSLDHSRDRFFPPLNGLERFDACELEGQHSPLWADNAENARWLELLHMLATVEDLYLSEGLALQVAPALQEFTRLGGTEVLHALRNLFIEEYKPGPVQEAIAEFVAARQLSCRPVDIQCWVRERRSRVRMVTPKPDLRDFLRNFLDTHEIYES